MPIAKAVSNTGVGIELKASVVLIRIGGIARNTSAVTAGLIPVPMMGIHKNRTARLGITRNTAKTPVIQNRTRRLRLQRIPSGIPTMHARAREMPQIATCSHSAIR